MFGQMSKGIFINFWLAMAELLFSDFICCLSLNEACHVVGTKLEVCSWVI